jgi:hypothetical protein
MPYDEEGARMFRRSFEIRTLVPVALLTIALAACSSGSVQTAPPTTALPTTAPPTAAPSPSIAVPAPSETACSSPEQGEDWQCSGYLPSGGHFEPGTYATLFEPGVTLTVDGYGESYVDSQSWLDLQYDHDDIYIQLSRFDQLWDPKHPPLPAPELCDICTTGGTLIDPPKDFASWLARLPGLTVVSPATSVRVGGLDARQLDVRSTRGVPIGPLAGFSNGVGAGLGGGTRYRLIAVTVSGRPILIAMSHGSMERGQAFIDSIVWR